jgi:hypothetical protein
VRRDRGRRAGRGHAAGEVGGEALDRVPIGVLVIAGSVRLAARHADDHPHREAHERVVAAIEQGAREARGLPARPSRAPPEILDIAARDLGLRPRPARAQAHGEERIGAALDVGEPFAHHFFEPCRVPAIADRPSDDDAVVAVDLPEHFHRVGRSHRRFEPLVAQDRGDALGDAGRVPVDRRVEHEHSGHRALLWNPFETSIGAGPGCGLTPVN